ncbi:MAG: VanZ family protein [Bacteroidota bacterium]
MNRSFRVIVNISWALFILAASTIGVGVNLPNTFEDLVAWDKLAHAAVYTIFGLLLYLFWRIFTGRQKAMIWSWSVAVSYGIAMEVVQYSFFPNRYFEIFDIFANIVGATISLLLIYFLTDKKSQSYG